MFSHLSRTNVSAAAQVRRMATLHGSSVKHNRWADEFAFGASVRISLGIVVPQVPRSFCFSGVFLTPFQPSLC